MNRRGTAEAGIARRSNPDGLRVLVPRPDHLGDVLLTLPAIRALRTRLPGAHITCMVPTNVIPIAERAVDVDEAVAMPFVMGDPPPLLRSPAVESAAAVLRARFDLALMTRPSDPWSGALVAAASLPLRVGHRQPATMPFLTHAFPERGSRHVAREAVMLALRAAALLGPVPRSPSSPRAWLRLLPEDRRKAADVLDRAGVGASAPVIVHPAAGWELKTWPLESWASLVSQLADRSRSPVLVVGQASDRPQLEAIVDAAGGRGHAVHDVPVGALAAIHAAARAVVGIDSGALHLAALVGAPVVGLFGPFGPGRVAPLGPRVRPVWRALPCSPCGTLETPPCGATREPACLRAISPRDVADAAMRLLSSSGRR